MYSVKPWSGHICIHVLYTYTLRLFALFCCWMCHISALWRGVVVSRRCTNVWLGRVVVCVCQQNRKRSGGGGAWDHWSQLKHESRRPTLPISCLHFISILVSVISMLLKHPMKALPQINVCASLFFMGLKWGTSSACPLHSPLFSFFAPFLCLLWDATREVIVSGLHYGSLKISLGRLKGQCFFLFFLRNKLLQDIRDRAWEKAN